MCAHALACVLASILACVCVHIGALKAILTSTKRYNLQYTGTVEAIRRFILALPSCLVEAPILLIWTCIDVRVFSSTCYEFPAVSTQRVCPVRHVPAVDYAIWLVLDQTHMKPI